MNTRKNILIGVTVIITVLLITIGVSYAFFTANLQGGEDTTTITVTGGTMNIVYNGGANINLANIIPDNNVAAVKTFTVTGNNTTDLPMSYQISLVIESNTFSEEALKYKLTSTNTDSNGVTVPSILELTNIGTGSKIIELGIGEFTSPTNGNKVHIYNLEIYFPSTGTNQNIDQEKEISAYIKIENYIKPTITSLNDAILGQIIKEGTPNFSAVPTINDSGLYVVEDEYGPSYYYRGLRDNLKNNLIFAGFQWKIIRINGDDSIRIIYNGTENEFNTNETMNTIGTSTQINDSAYNATEYFDNKYVGYMYGGANGVASTVRNGTTSAAAAYNQTNTKIKTEIDTWYQSNMTDNIYVSKVADNLFCNDRQLISEVGGAVTGTGYGTSQTHFAPYYRLITSKIPTLKCGLKNDRFTANDITTGNGALNYPVGLLSADEATIAGLVAGRYYTTNYLYNNQNYWTLSPSGLYGPVYTHGFIVSSAGTINHEYVKNIYGIRPVISLIPDIMVTGEGTETSPFIVQN